MYDENYGRQACKDPLHVENGSMIDQEQRESKNSCKDKSKLRESRVQVQ